MTDQDVSGQRAAAQAAPLSMAKGPVGRVRALIGRHKLGTAIVALLVAAGAAGVATGSLNSRPASSTSTISSDGTGSIVYAHPAAAPAFSLPALSYGGPAGAGSAAGSTGPVSLGHYAGQALIVNFFASWCSPCQRETPLIAGFYKANGRHVAIVGVDGSDTTEKAVAFVRAKGVSYLVGEDPRAIIASSYDVAEFPQTFFLNSQHQIVFRVIGAITRAQLAQGVRLMDGHHS